MRAIDRPNHGIHAIRRGELRQHGTRVAQRVCILQVIDIGVITGQQDQVRLQGLDLLDQVQLPAGDALDMQVGQMQDAQRLSGDLGWARKVQFGGMDIKRLNVQSIHLDCQ